MAEDFAASVEEGLNLSKKLYPGRGRAATVAPRPLPSMLKSNSDIYLPKAPMLYAVITDPSIIDDPDKPTYQPYVYGRIDPPALIPLLLNRVHLHTDTFLDTASVRVDASWRLHCVKPNKACDCLLAVPMGLHGSILGVEIDAGSQHYYTDVIDLNEEEDEENKQSKKLFHGIRFVNLHIFLLTFPKVPGGSIVSIKIHWAQRLLCTNGRYVLSIPFSFPEYTSLPSSKNPKKQTITVNVNLVDGMKIKRDTSSHPLKERRGESGQLSFLYEEDVLIWTKTDFEFSYTVSPSDLLGGIVVQSPYESDVFSVHLFSGDQALAKAFRKKVVFVVDASRSMNGQSLEATTKAISEAIANLDSNDSFNIIAFNGEMSSFSESLESATLKNTEKASQWMMTNLIASGKTNIFRPLSEAMRILSSIKDDAVPIVLLITDGAVEDERHICEVVKIHANGELKPRVYTFGIGSFCNHQFLRTLAMLSRGQYQAAFDANAIKSRMDTWITSALAASLVDISIDDFSLYPELIPDLSRGSTVQVFIKGPIGDSAKVRGVLGDLTWTRVDLKRVKVEDGRLLKIIFGKERIERLTSLAWMTCRDEMEREVKRVSVETGVVSEFTGMEMGTRVGQERRRVYSGRLRLGFGNVEADEVEELMVPIKERWRCGGGGRCCMGCIICCDKMGDQCASLLAQFCMALTWIACFECCSSLCSGDGD